MNLHTWKMVQSHLKFDFELPFTNISTVNWKPSVFSIGLAMKFPITKPDRENIRFDLLST